MSLVVPIYVARATNENDRGIVVSEHLVPQIYTNEAGEQIVKQLPLLGVCWDDTPSPAIDYCSPSDLQFLGIVDGLEDDEEDEDDGEYDEEFETEISRSAEL